MLNNPAQTDINKRIDRLRNIVGINKNIPTRKLFYPFGLLLKKSAPKYIKDYMRLPVKLQINYFRDGTNFSKNMLHLHTSDTFNQQNHTQAQVLIPSNLPLYSDTALKGFPVTVEMLYGCKGNPHTFAYTLAHELSHILLASLAQTQTVDEKDVDLVAMLLGFTKVMVKGRESTESSYLIVVIVQETTRYGYLSDLEFRAAYNYISELHKQV